MILTIGCSFTEGVELNNPAVDAWPAIVGRCFNKSVKNAGIGGGSCDYIFRTAIEETIAQSYDLVIIEWTEPSRMEVWWCDKNQPVNVTANSRFSQIGAFAWMKDFYKYSYSDFHGYRKQALQYVALQEYFKSIGQKYIFTNLAGLRPHGNWKEYQESIGPIWNRVDKEFFVGWPHEGFLEWQGDCPKGPEGHPLELGHQRIANKINEHIRNLGWLS
jgi:lysophospholipase L1-like esterase